MTIVYRGVSIPATMQSPVRHVDPGYPGDVVVVRVDVDAPELTRFDLLKGLRAVRSVITEQPWPLP